MDAICVNDKYDSKTLEVFAKNKIKYPKKDEIVYITRIHKYTLQGGKVGFFLAGYEGQFIQDPNTLNINELSFNSSRFKKLDGTDFLKEDLKKIKELVN